MKEAWTGQVVGDMHVYEITFNDIASKTGYNPKYVCALLNGSYKADKARKKIEAAMYQLIAEKERNT